MTNSKEVKALSEDEKTEAINQLKSLVIAGKEEGFNLRTDDTFMLRFLHCSKFNVTDAWAHIKLLYKLKSNIPQYFGQASPEEYDHILTKHVKYLLNGRDRNGRTVFVSTMGNIDTNTTTLEEVTGLDDLFMELVLDELETQENGIAAIIDVKNYSWRLFSWLTPSSVRATSQKLEAYPISNLQLHIVNTSRLVNAAIALVFPFLSAKTKESIHFHSDNWASLHKHIDPKILPIQYGGEVADESLDKIGNILHENKTKLSKLSEYFYDKKTKK